MNSNPLRRSFPLLRNGAECFTVKRGRSASLTADRLRELLNYDLDTGVLTWKARPHPRASRVQIGMMSGCINSSGYLMSTIDGAHHLCHRLAWLHVYGTWPAGDLDHANGDKRDNRIGNLRIATSSQNGANGRLRKNNSSGLKGATFHHRRKRWYAKIKHQGRTINLGQFLSAADAHAAYMRAAAYLFGEFARAA